MSQRHIHFKGTFNFRDIGGYAVNSSVRVKTGMIFRSGRLSRLTTRDLKRFEALGIKLVVDLRNEHERSAEPSRLPKQNTPKTQVLSLLSASKDTEQLKKQIFAGKLRELDFREFMLSEYRNYVTQHAHQIATMFQLLLVPDNYPMLIHCNGGKDRTGTVTALIHAALGLSKQTIFDDYMLSGKHLAGVIKKTLLKIKLMSFFRANPNQLKPLFETRKEYLQEALNTIEGSFGSIDSYLDTLGMHQQYRHKLTDILCHAS